MKNYLFLLAIALVLFSCNKKTPSPATVSAYDYFPMKPGNYWVYGQFQGDTNGVNNTGNTSTDSVWVQNDTVIGGNTYYVLYVSPGATPDGIYRDSSGYMIDNYGSILFSARNFTSVLADDSMSYGLNGVIDYHWQMVNNVMVATPAGVFSTIQYKGFITYCTAFPLNPKFYKSYNYAKHTGLVLIHTFFQNNPNAILEQQLLRYHIQ